MAAPKRTDAELKARGSTLASTRAAEKKRAHEQAALRKANPDDVDFVGPPLPETPAEWSALIRSLPKFDPYLLAAGCRFDAEAATKPILWIQRNVRHMKGPKAGQPFILERWQRAMVANLFGWVRESDGLRRFREVLLYVAKKNGKSLLVAGLALYLALEDGEAGAEVYCAAAKMGQAKIIWNDCVTQLKRIDPDEERAERYQHSIALPGGGFLKPISADADTEDGMNPSAALIDELHRQPDDRLVNVMRQSTAARSQPVVIMLTTADEDRESVCNETLERAKQVRDNPGDATRPGFDPKFLPVIYEADPKDDWTSPDTWRKANPNLGVSVSPEFLADSCRNAKDNPSLLPDFLRYHLNVRARGGARKLFPDMTLWDACGAAFDVETLRGKDCVVGVDLSSTTDITALVAVFPESMHVLAWFWVPEDAAKKRDVRNDRIYTTWAAAGLLTLTEGNQIDEARVLDEMLLNLAPYKVREVGIDPWNSVRYTQPMMERGLPVVAVRQGWVTLSEPTKYLSTLVGNVQTPGRPHLKHGGNPVLRWMAGNAELDVDKKGNWSLTKPNGGAKIDGIAALATAFARVVVAPKPPPQYDPVVV